MNKDPLLQVLLQGDVEVFRDYCLEQNFFVARDVSLISMQEWRALFCQACLGYEEMADKHAEMTSWLASNGFFKMLL